MVIKTLTKKVLITTAMASSLFVLPHVAPTHHAHAATITINTTHQVLSNGSYGSAVKSLQTRLDQLGYFNYKIDGAYGPLTEGSVKKFQRANHLVVDGVAGPNTLGKLFNSTSSTPAKVSAPAKTRSISISTSTSMSLKTVQSKLQNLGYYHDSIDGVYGPHTRAAVMGFQRNNHLVVDGIPGPNTKAKLASSSAVGASSGSSRSTISGTVSSSKSGNTIKTTSFSSTSQADQIIADAKALQGIQYKWGGTTTSGFDCSGYTQYVFRENGISLPRTAAQQYASGKPTSLVPGVLVFFSTISSGVSHVGIYIGNNEFISATTSRGVYINSMDNPYWKPRYLGARAY